jgi:type 1 glutamine amidotransferase
LRLLVFTKTAGFRHGSIENGKTAFTSMAQRRTWALTFSENSSVFAPQSLAQFDVVVFLNTTGDILNAAEQNALEAFATGGGGFVGIHSASDTEYDWAFYGSELVGAYFMSHPATQPATVNRTETDHQSTRHLPKSWMRTDEWYNFRAIPPGAFDILLTVDEKTYTGGTMGAAHPIAWSRTVGSGRSLYTALGHTTESWSEPLFLKHVEEAVAWAGGR